MTSAVAPATGERVAWPAPSTWPRQAIGPALLVLVAAVILFASPAISLGRQWWFDDDAGHGLLLFPLSLWLMWRAGLDRTPQPSRLLGIVALFSAIVFRALGGLAAELYTQRMAMWLALVGVILFVRGWGLIRLWWLPLSLLALSIPLPDVIMNALAMPLQLLASEWGSALIEWRHIPVHRAGNVMTIISQDTGDPFRLFVAEACSGLRSLTALLALGVAVGGLNLRSVTGRVLLALLAIPVAIALNTLRVFLTAFLMYYVSPAFGDGFMHYSQGWGVFAVAILILGLIAAVIRLGEVRIARWRQPAATGAEP